MAKRHHDDFKEFRSDDDAAFAVAVREVSASHRKEDERQREERADDENQIIPLILRKIHCHDDVNDEKLEGVVVEGVLKLRDDQAPEAALPAIF